MKKNLSNILHSGIIEAWKGMQGINDWGRKLQKGLCKADVSGINVLERKFMLGIYI